MLSIQDGRPPRAREDAPCHGRPRYCPCYRECKDNKLMIWSTQQVAQVWRSNGAMAGAFGAFNVRLRTGRVPRRITVKDFCLTSCQQSKTADALLAPEPALRCQAAAVEAPAEPVGNVPADAHSRNGSTEDNMPTFEALGIDERLTVRFGPGTCAHRSCPQSQELTDAGSPLIQSLKVPANAGHASKHRGGSALGDSALGHS